MGAEMGRRLRLAPLFAALLLGAAFAPAAGAATACDAAHVSVVDAASVREAQQATLCLLNGFRAHAGLRPLRLNAHLSAAASAHSRDMVAKRYFAHDSLNGRTPFQRMLDTHYVPHAASWRLGENIGWGSASLAQPSALVRMWMHSPPHRANILSRQFRDIGIGVAAGVPVRGEAAGGTYTTDFGAHS
jgi:uncharacterized protein YkwD